MAKSFKAVPLEQRLNLINRAKAGDSKALEEYRKLNIGLMRNVIKQYSKWISEDEVDDLHQEAFIGLHKGILSYNPTRSRGAPESYIFLWVSAYVGRYAKTHGMGAKEQPVGCVQTDNFHEDDLPDGSSDPREQALRKIDESPCQESKYYSHELDYWMDNITSELLPKERVVYRRRCVADVPETLEDIGTDMGLSRERIRQIEMDIAEKLKKKVLRDMPAMADVFASRESKPKNTLAAVTPKDEVFNDGEEKEGARPKRHVRARGAVSVRRKAKAVGV